jgi:hypothetical protein
MCSQDHGLRASEHPIATVVDDFIDRIMVDGRLNKNPRVDEAHHRVLPPGFKYPRDGDAR